VICVVGANSVSLTLSDRSRTGAQAFMAAEEKNPDAAELIRRQDRSHHGGQCGRLMMVMKGAAAGLYSKDICGKDQRTGL